MNVRGIAFCALCVLQLAAAASGIARYERVLASGQAVLLAVAPVDPYDPFRGRYVTLSFALEQGAHPVKGKVPQYGEPAYVVLKTDAKKVASVDYLTASPPDSGLWLKAESSWPESETTARVSLPMKRYYMNEALAPAAEQAYREAVARDAERAGDDSYARVRILNGAVVIEQVLLDGVPIERAAQSYKD